MYTHTQVAGHRRRGCTSTAVTATVLLLCLSSAAADVQTFTAAISKLLPPAQIVQGAGIEAPYMNRFGLADFAPAVMVFPNTVSDVVTVANTARANNVTLAIRTGAGHSYIGQSTNAGGVVVNMEKLKAVTATGSSNVVAVGAGLTLIELYTKLAMQEPEPLGFNGGSCPSVGVSGFLSGGGMGMMSPTYGMGSDRVVAADVVVLDADSGAYHVVHATRDNEYADLLFSLRGGMGGNYGIVTTWFLQAFVAPPQAVLFSFKTGSGAAAPTAAAAVKTVTAFEEYMETHNDLGMWTEAKVLSGTATHFEGQCACEEPACTACSAAVGAMQEAVFGSTTCGGTGDFLAKCSVVTQPFDKAMWSRAGCTAWGGTDAWPSKGLRSSSAAEVDAALDACITWDRAQDTSNFFAKSLFLPITSATRTAALSKAVATLNSPACAGSALACVIQLEQFDGQATQEPNDSQCGPCTATGRSTAWVHRTPGWHAQIIVEWPTSDGANVPTAKQQWSTEVYDALLPASLNEAYQNYIDSALTPAQWQQQYFGGMGVVKQLSAVKAKYNPENLLAVKHVADMEVPLPS